MAANPNPNGDEQYVDLSRAQTLGKCVLLLMVNRKLASC